jgi:hypothetical protein
MTTTQDHPADIRPQPPWRRRHRKLFIALGAFGMLLLIIIVVSIATNGSHPTSATSTPPTTSAPASPAKSMPAAAYPAEAADKALRDTYNTDIKSGDTASIQAALHQAGRSVSPGLAKDIGVVTRQRLQPGRRDVSGGSLGRRLGRPGGHAGEELHADGRFQTVQSDRPVDQLLRQPVHV